MDIGNSGNNYLYINRNIYLGSTHTHIYAYTRIRYTRERLFLCSHIKKGGKTWGGKVRREVIQKGK